MKYLLLCLLAAFLSIHAHAVDYRVVAMAPLSGANQIPSDTVAQWTSVLDAHSVAISAAWANGHSLSVTIEDTQSSKYRALQIAADASSDPLVLGVIHAGIPNSDIEELARYFRINGVPSISVSTTDADSIDPTADFFFSLHVEHAAVDLVLSSLMEEYSWNRIALLYDEEYAFVPNPSHWDLSMKCTATKVAELNPNYHIYAQQFISATDFSAAFQLVLGNSLSVIAVFSRDVAKVSSLLQQAELTYGIFLKGYSWIVFADPEAYNFTQGIIVAQSASLPSANIPTFTAFLETLPGAGTNPEILEESPRIYDALTIFGSSIFTALGQSGTRQNVRDAIKATVLPNGMSGSISFVSKGFRSNSPYSIWNVHPNATDDSKNVLVPIYDWDGALTATGSEIIFVGPTTEIPDSEVEVYNVAWLSHRPSYPLSDIQMTELGNYIADACNGFTSVSFPIPSTPIGGRLRVSVLSVGAYGTSNELMLIPTAIALPAYGVTGVLAQMNSELTELAENILSPYGVPVLSDTATGPSLSNKARYPTFMRTVASSDVQGAALASLCHYFGWTEVTVIHSSTTAGSGLAQAVGAKAFSLGISIPMSISLDPSAFTYAPQLAGFFEAKPRIVLLLIEFDVLRVLLNDFAAAGYKAEAYVGSDGISYALFNPTSAAINIDPTLLYGFVGTRPAGGFGSSYDSFISDDLPALPIDHGIRKTFNEFGSAFVANFLDSVLVYADGIKRLKSAGGNPRNGTALYAAMRATNSLFLTGDVSFNSDGDRLGSYEVFNFLPGASAAVLRGRVDASGTVSLSNAIVWPSGTTDIPIAVLPRNLKWLDWKSGGGIVMAIFGGLGILASAIMFAVMVHQRKSPVVMVATWQFLLVMLFGCAMGFGSVFTWIGRPYEYTCALRVWIPPMAFILIMAPLLTKTWRLHRIFTLRSLKVKSYPLSYLIVICAVLLAIQVVICIFWIALGTIKPAITNDPNDKTIAYVVCGSNRSNRIASYITYGYLGILMLVGCYLTFRVRNLPKDFNESRWIGFAIYNTLLFSVIIIIVGYALSKFPITVLILICVCTIAISTGAVAFMLAPKIWTLIRHPEKRSSSSGTSVNTTASNSTIPSRKVATGPRHNFSKGTSRDTTKNDSKQDDSGL